MAELTEVRVPDIGDFSEVPVIEILVEVGDRIRPEDPLVTLESDKGDDGRAGSGRWGGARGCGVGGRQRLRGLRPVADRGRRRR